MPLQIPSAQELKQADQEYLVKHNVQVRNLDARRALPSTLTIKAPLPPHHAPNNSRKGELTSPPTVHTNKNIFGNKMPKMLFTAKLHCQPACTDRA